MINIPVPRGPEDMIILVIQAGLLLFTIAYAFRALINPQAVAAAMAALLLVMLAMVYSRQDDFYIKTVISLVKSSQIMSFVIGIISSGLIALLVTFRHEPALCAILVFLATAILFGGLFGASLLSEVAIAGAAGKCIGLAVGHGLCAQLWPERS